MSNRKKPKKKQQRPESRPAVVDFDALLAKRHTTKRQLPPIKIGGELFTLPPTLPLSVTDTFAEHARIEESGTKGETNTIVLIDDMKKLLAEMFGEEQWAKIRRHIDMTDVPVLFARVFETYGESVGESSGSGQS